MDVRINELQSTVQTSESQVDVARIVREHLQALKEMEEREKRAATERNLSSSIRADTP
jgi:hypothetical protein